MTALARHRRAAERPVFPGGPAAYVSPTERSAVSVARLTLDVDGGDVFEGSMPADDAYVALFQLRDHPAHQFRANGRFHRAAAAPRGGLNIVDLRSEPLCQLRHPVDTLMLHLPRGVIDEIAAEAGAPKVDALVVPEPWRTPDKVFAQLQGLIADGMTSEATADTLLYDHLLHGLAAHLVATYGGLQPGHAAQRGGLAPWQARRAKDLLAGSLAKELSLQEIAQECGLSLAYFTRAFKVSTGSTPHAWRQARRVDRAKELLAVGMPLAEVAVECGFADQSHFSRVFVQQAGATPRAWQRLRHAA